MTRLARAIALASVVLAVATCTRAGGGETAGPPNPTQVNAVSPTPSGQGTPVVQATASSHVALTPGQFWTALFSGDPEAVNYPTLADMFKDSDVVVLGSFASVTAGPNSDAGAGSTNYMLTVTVKVDRVLRGSLPSAASGVPIAVFLGVGSSAGDDPYAALFASRAASMPKERGVFFLQNLVAYYSRFDPSASQRYDPTVYQVTSMQGLIRDAAGASWVPDQTPGNWAAGLAGRPFDTVLAELQAAGSGMGG